MSRAWTRAATAVDRWLFAPGPGSQVWVLRTGLALLFSWRLATGRYIELAEQPAVLFRPPLLWRWLAQMPPAEVLVVVQGVGLVLALLAVAGRRPRWTFAGAWLCFVFLEGLVGSRVKVAHNQILPILAAMPLLLAPAAVSWRDRVHRATTGWPARASLVVVAGAYTFSGVAKVVTAGPAWVFSDNLRWVLLGGTLSHRPPTDAVARFVADHAVLVLGMATFALLLELTFFVVLVSERIRVPYAVGAVALHAGIWVTLGLDYWSWALTAVLVLVSWDRVLDRGQALVANRSIRPSSRRAQAT